MLNQHLERMPLNKLHLKMYKILVIYITYEFSEDITICCFVVHCPLYNDLRSVYSIDILTIVTQLFRFI